MRIRGARSLGWGLFLVVCQGLQLLALFSRGTHAYWAREPGSALDWALGAVPLVAACLAGAACLAVRSVLPWSTGVEGIARVRATRLIGYAVGPGIAAALVSTALTVGIASIVTVQARGEFVLPATGGLMAVVVVMYLASAALGAAAGIVWPGPITPFLVTSAGTLTVFLAGPLGVGPLVRIGGSTGTVADQLLRPGTVFTWCLGLIWVAVPALLLVGALVAGGGTRRLLTVSAVAALCALPLVATGGGGSGAAYATNPSFPDRCAQQTGLVVCTRAGSTFEAAPTARAMAPFVRAVDALGVTPRPRTWGVVTSVPSAGSPAGRAWMFADSAGSTTPTPEEFSQAVMMPRECSSIDQDQRLLSTLVVASEWVQAEATGTANPALDGQQRAWLRDPAARRWAATAAVGLGTCDVSKVQVPPTFRTARTGLSW